MNTRLVSIFAFVTLSAIAVSPVCDAQINPFSSLSENVARAARHGLRTEVTLDCSLEGGCHEGGSFAAGPGFDAGASWPAASHYASCWRGLWPRSYQIVHGAGPPGLC